MNRFNYIFFCLVFGAFNSIGWGKTQDTVLNKPAVPVFENGEAQIVPAFSDEEQWIHEEVWVETTFDSDVDGRLDRMHVIITRPLQTKTEQLKLPVIYQTSPYYGLKIGTLLKQAMRPLSKKYFWKVKHELGEAPKTHKHPKLRTRKKPPFAAKYINKSWLPRGYIMVYSSSPGTGFSDGVATIGGENESLAPKAVIDWLCGRAKAFTSRRGTDEVVANWSTGKVGMMGASYDGTLCLAAATTGVEGLEAIVPVAPISAYYNYYRSNGLVRSPSGYLGEDMDVLYDFINTGDKANRPQNNRRVRDSILVASQDRITGDYNKFWQERDYVRQIGNMKAAMLMAHGFNDWNVMPEQSFRFYKAAKEKGLPVQLYYHQRGHGGYPPMTLMNRWFTRYLHGITNGVEEDAPVWIVRERESKPTPYDHFPDAAAKEVTFYLHLDTLNNGELSVNRADIQPLVQFTDNYKLDFRELSKPKNEAHRLLFTTSELERPVRISGVPSITIKMTADKPSANLSVYLISIEQDEKEIVRLINKGWADPQNHSSLWKSTPLKSDQFVELTFDLMPDDQVIPAGHKIGLLIFSSDQDHTICPKPGTKLMVDPNGTYVAIPIVGGV